MKVLDIYSAQLQNAHDHIAQVLQGLNSEQLNYRPNDYQHGIGFAAWHALRTWDGYYSLITRSAPVYESGNWLERFGFDTRGKGAGGAGTGTGFTAQDVAAMNLSIEPLRDFLETVTSGTLQSLARINDDVLFDDAVVPWWNPPTTTFGRVLTHIVAHTFMHIGEAEYVRGLIGK
jgi:hypothetical protein